MTQPGSYGYDWCDEMNMWMDVVTGRFELPPDLIPTERPLNFHPEFINEIIVNPNLDCVGIYTNGWEL